MLPDVGNTCNTVFTNCKRQRRRPSLLLDSCFSIVSEPEQAACSKHAVQIQLQSCKNFTQVVMQFRKSRLEYISTFSLLCTPWMAVVIHTSGVTCKVQSSSAYIYALLAIPECQTWYKTGVSNLWNGLWNGLMEWTDGMEYQLTKICKTYHHGCGEVVNAVSLLLASTISQFEKQPHYW